MYRPSDASLDFSLPVQAGSDGVQQVSVADMKPGNWTMEINWNSQGITLTTPGQVSTFSSQRFPGVFDHPKDTNVRFYIRAGVTG